MPRTKTVHRRDRRLQDRAEQFRQIPARAIGLTVEPQAPDPGVTRTKVIIEFDMPLTLDLTAFASQPPRWSYFTFDGKLWQSDVPFDSLAPSLPEPTKLQLWSPVNFDPTNFWTLRLQIGSYGLTYPFRWLRAANGGEIQIDWDIIAGFSGPGQSIAANFDPAQYTPIP